MSRGSEEAFDCLRYRDNYMCAFQKEGPREPCPRCPNNPENLRRRLDSLAARLEAAFNDRREQMLRARRAEARADTAERERDHWRKAAESLRGPSALSASKGEAG